LKGIYLSCRRLILRRLEDALQCACDVVHVQRKGRGREYCKHGKGKDEGKGKQKNFISAFPVSSVG
jgi:hypothetical protein